jgi:serine/threonine protein kinase
LKLIFKRIEGVFISLLLGVFALHYEGIIHGDIKPSNIFVRNDNISFALGLFVICYFHHFFVNFAYR